MVRSRLPGATREAEVCRRLTMGNAFTGAVIHGRRMQQELAGHDK
jgi:hypothetical protein